MAYRPDWWPENSTLLSLVDELHSYNTGSSEMDPQIACKYRLALEYARDTWRSNHNAYEYILYLLICAVLTETYKRIEEF